MSNVAMFLTGAFFTLPVAGGLYVLIRAAIADGRRNDRVHSEQADLAERSRTIG